MQYNTDHFMELALVQAQEAFARDEVPIGAVLFAADGTVVASAGNQVEELNDPTAHAEMLVIKKACAALDSKVLDNYMLAVTLEPCAMCAQAISLAKINTIYFGAHDVKGGGVVNGARIFEQKTCHHRPQVVGGVMEGQARELIQSFFKTKR